MCPIESKRLESEGKEVGTEPRESRKEQVLAFLKDNADKAYTQAEVAKACNIGKTHAHSVLMNLVEKNVVDRKEYTEDGKTRIFYALK